MLKAPGDLQASFAGHAPHRWKSPVSETSRLCAWENVEEGQTVFSPPPPNSPRHGPASGERHSLSTEEHLSLLSDHSVNFP